MPLKSEYLLANPYFCIWFDYMNEYLYVTALGKFKEFMKITLHDKKVPTKVDEDWLASVGYTDKKNDRRFIPILKELGFISDDGTPTEAYSEYRNKDKSKEIMLKALKDAYPDLFSTYEDPFTESSANISNLIKNKKNYSQEVANLATRTFKTLATASGIIVDTETTLQKRSPRKGVKTKEESGEGGSGKTKEVSKESNANSIDLEPVSIVINIQLVLPNTTEKEVYSNLFSELRRFISKEKQNEP
jgi:hypothetical protein